MSIGKRLIIIFLSSFFGITAVPDILVSADEAPIADVKFAEVSSETVSSTSVSTTVATTSTPKATTTQTATKPVTKTKATVTQAAPAQTTTPAPAVTPAPTPAPAVKPNQINIAGRTISVTTGIKDLSVDAGNHANLYWNGKFIYGHNSANVFAGLKNLGVGSTFTMTIDGVTSTYRVGSRVIYNYESTANGNGTLRLPGDEVTNYHLRIIKGIDYNAMTGAKTQYDLALMTCHGQSLGNGNATQRLVLFANKI